jgi:glycosyltransferase involved in cell wall biosynthesis
VGEDLSAFLPPIEAVLRSRHEVKRFVCKTAMDVEDALSWCEASWCEWSNEVAVAASKSRIRRPLVVRLHSYEAVIGVAHLVDWSRVSRLVYVAEHVLACLRAKVPALPPTVFLPSAIDLTRFPFQEHGPGFRIGMVAAVRGIKGVALAAQVLAMARHPDDGTCDERYTLHIAGGVEDERFRLYLEHITKQLRIEGAIVLDGQVADIAAWWRDKDWNLSCSAWEGHPYGVIESMACGVRPLVHHYLGAAEQFPEGVLWTDARDAAAELTAVPDGCVRDPSTWYGSARWRAWVEERNDVAKQAPTILATMENLR